MIKFMKIMNIMKYSFLFIFLLLISPIAVRAQGMMGQFDDPTLSNQSSTAQEEAEGKIVWERLQTNEVSCKDLSDDDFDVLGEYFMGTRMGSSHENMNAMMGQMFGEEGERKMHISMGKRLSGCDISYPIPTDGTKFLPMMGMMSNINNQYPTGNYFNTMMGGWMSSSGLFGSIIWILVATFLILGIIYFWKEIHIRK